MYSVPFYQELLWPKGADVIFTVDRMFLKWLGVVTLVHSLGEKGLGGASSKVNNGSLITATQIACI